jgi:hypothetical protein
MLPLAGPDAAASRRRTVRLLLVALVVVVSAVLIALVVGRSTPGIRFDGPTGQPSASGRSGGSAFDPRRVAVTLEPVVDGLAQPLAIANAADGSNRLFVAERDEEPAAPSAYGLSAGMR